MELGVTELDVYHWCWCEYEYMCVHWWSLLTEISLEKGKALAELRVTP